MSLSKISHKKYLLPLWVICCLCVVFAGCQDKNNATNTTASSEGGSGEGRGGGGRGGPGRGMMGGGAMRILMLEEAQAELTVTDEQKQKLEEDAAAMRESFTPPAQGERPDPAHMQEQMQKMQTENRKLIESILAPEQVAKLDVMVFQQGGGLEGQRISVDSLRALDLTDDQKTAIGEAQAKMRTATEGINFREASDEDREKMQTARDEFQATLKGLLTEEQLAKAEELMKEVPEYLQRRGGPGGGGPGGLPPRPEA